MLTTLEFWVWAASAEPSPFVRWARRSRLGL